MKAANQTGTSNPRLLAYPQTSRHSQEMYRGLRDAGPMLAIEGVGHVLKLSKAAPECFVHGRPEPAIWRFFD